MAWQIDSQHTQIEFTVRHLMISDVRGRFERFTGTVDFDEENPIASRVEMRIEAASVSTKEPERDDHVTMWPAFLDVTKFPYLYFKSKRVEKIDDSHGRIIGDLTIRDITREVVLDAKYAGQAKSHYGYMKAGFSATTVLDRRDWGVTWNKAVETGGVLVGNEVKVDIQIEVMNR